MVPSWSPDGNQLVGQSGFPGTGILTYSFETETYQRLTDFGEWPAWLPDSRQIMFVSDGKEFFVVDSRSKEVQKVFSEERDVIGPPRLSHDGSEVFFTRRVTEADVWLLTLSED
jgi:Tol biopolymer transport system component